jgi:hypothetical protein
MAIASAVLTAFAVHSFFSALRFPHRKTCLPKVKQDIAASPPAGYLVASHTARKWG